MKAKKKFALTMILSMVMFSGISEKAHAQLTNCGLPYCCPEYWITNSTLDTVNLWAYGDFGCGVTKVGGTMIPGADYDAGSCVCPPIDCSSSCRCFDGIWYAGIELTTASFLYTNPQQLAPGKWLWCCNSNHVSCPGSIDKHWYVTSSSTGFVCP